MQVLQKSDPFPFLAEEEISFVALQSLILISTKEFSIAYNISGPVSRFGPEAILASYRYELAISGGMMV